MDPRAVLHRPAPGPDRVLRYDDSADGVIDLFLPAGEGTVPLVVFLHGGFWRVEWDRTHVRPLAAALVAAGFAVAVPEYRRVGADGGWPQTGSDVETALRVVRRLVATTTPGRIDETAPLLLAGHSAGGHLALWAGLRAGPDVVRRIVALAPVTDLRYAARTEMGDRAAQDLLGGEPADIPDVYDDADAARLLPGVVPVTIVQGDADEQVPVAMNRSIAERLGSTGRTLQTAAATSYIELPEVDHFALIDPESAAWPAVVRALTAD